MEKFNFVHKQPVDWGDMDAYNHVNNVIYFRYFESARIAYLENLGWWDKLLDLNIGVIVGSLKCRYRKPVTHPDILDIGVRIERLQHDRFMIIYAAYSHKEKAVVADGESLMISYDVVLKKRTPLPEALRSKISECES